MPASLGTDMYTLSSLQPVAVTYDWENGAGRLSPEAESFLDQCVSHTDTQGLRNLSPETLVKLINEFWKWSKIRAGEPAIVRTRRVAADDGTDVTLLEIAGPDMPFLVGSVLGACRALNIQTGMVLHPILEHGRAGDGSRQGATDGERESYIQVHLDLLDATTADNLVEEITATLADVRACVRDFDAMMSEMRRASDSLEGNTRVSADEIAESKAFLNWLANGHFTFLGSRSYRFAQNPDGSLAAEEPEIMEGTGLGILKDSRRFILHRGSEPTIITQQISEFLNEPDPLMIAKASMESRVHRRVRADYVGVKQYDNQGQVVGEIRFVGLFTADAYNAMTKDVPLIRRKVDRAMQAAAKRPGSHDANALKHILETFPRDELFQIPGNELLDIASSILRLQDRIEPRLFVRKDRFNRYISALVFVPRESFNSDLRARIGKTLERAFNGKLRAFYPLYGDAPLARIQYLLDLDPNPHSPNLGELESEIANLARSWKDQLRSLIRTQQVPLPAGVSEEDITSAFNAAYREAFDAEEALRDISCIDQLTPHHTVVMRAFRGPRDPLSVIRAKIYTLTSPVQLSECVPVFENMGLFVQAETGFPIQPHQTKDTTHWVHNVEMRSRDGSPIDLQRIRAQFEGAFEAVWTHRTENDGFNKLVFAIGASWREAALFRTLCRYRKQTGLDPAQTTQIMALSRNPHISELLLTCFRLRFDPDLELTTEEREARCQQTSAEITTALNNVESLDEDRVLQRLSTLIYAIKRTSFYQLNEHGEPLEFIAIKIASRELEFLPEPKPFREIFVCAPHVEGVHLRFGPVARGGLRWSDRRDDFRTEVLGLVKAQQVKNAVIVPVGSKGGFYPKQLPVDGGREAFMDEGIRSYKTFISALLSLTDNLMDGTLRHPRRVVIWDEPDPYLVVAADKGTATFSDIANGISESYGFWLGDAFASGGSAGYDHKKMGITARGAWVAVQRHFREMDIDIQSEKFSVTGVGDMSGDVFGNGMLLSRTIRLKAAFNHMHIFLDPDPVDTEACWEERKRLFDLPRSTWMDYDQSLISKGGGVFPRSAKSIELTEEIKSFLGVEDDQMAPTDLIQAILKAETDLLWFGGIGTYVRATTETDLQVGDKANDAVRIAADQLRVKVVGEGANLGVTQAARIEFARHGGRINSDAIDNSAGVDSSDHEVNIKILLRNAIESQELDADKRNSLLSSMTDEVAEKVLVHNYDQTGALSVAEASAAMDLDSHERMIERLEAAGLLNRSVEGLPKADEFRLLREKDLGLTRPEIAVLLAYAKITLFDELVSSNVPDDAFLSDMLSKYFPEPLRSFQNALDQHRLKREIIATQLANNIINLGGATFIHRVKERAGVDTPSIARAYMACKAIFSLDDLLDHIDGLDNLVPASTQIHLRADLINALRRQVFWLAKTREVGGQISGLVDAYKPGVDSIVSAGKDTLSPYERGILEAKEEQYRDDGAPSDIAHKVAVIVSMTSATDIVDLARRSHHDVISTACLFNAVGSVFEFDRLRETALNMSLDQHWDRLAARGLVETLLGQQYVLAERISAKSEMYSVNNFELAKRFVDEMVTEYSDSYRVLRNILAELEHSGAWTFAKLVLFANATRSFIDETDLGAT